MKLAFATAAFATLLLAPALAFAEPGLANEVYGATVTRGQTDLELRGGILDGDDASGEWQIKAEVAHGVTDWWRPGLVAEWEYEGDDAEFTAFAIENLFDITATRDWPVHFGAYVEYEFKQDGADALELKLLMQRERGPLDLRLNLIAEREVGSGSEDEWEYGYAAQGSYAFNDDFALGLQGFGDAGTSDSFGGANAHYWGPFAQFEIGETAHGEFELQIAYLAGMGETEADGQLRIQLEYEFGGR